MPKKRIGLSFRKVNDYNQLLSVLKQVCCFAKDINCEVDLLYQVDEDRALCLRLHKDLGRDTVNFSDELIDYYKLSTYNKYDMVISNRLHVLLMAAMNGSLPFGVLSNNSNEQKIACIFSGVCNDKYIARLDSFNISDITSIYSTLESHMSDLQEQVGIQRGLCINTIKSILQN